MRTLPPGFEFDNELFDRINAAVNPEREIATLAGKRPNTIVTVGRDGVLVETLRSEGLQTGPQLVPAWMIATAWDQLQKKGSLSNKELLDDLNVKRSSFVMALLAEFSDVVVRSTRPLVIELVAGDGT